MSHAPSSDRDRRASTSCPPQSDWATMLAAAVLGGAIVFAAGRAQENAQRAEMNRAEMHRAALVLAVTEALHAARAPAASLPCRSDPVAAQAIEPSAGHAVTIEPRPAPVVHAAVVEKRAAHPVRYAAVSPKKQASAPVADDKHALDSPGF